MARINRATHPTLAFALLAACLAGFGPPIQDPKPAAAAPDGPAAADDRTPYDATLATKTVKFWDEMSRKDPRGSIACRQLAAAYLARQRETGDIGDAVHAEEAARRSLKILARNNSAGWTLLGRALLTQHRFPEALEAARKAAATDAQADRLIADIQLEIGDYDDAARALAALGSETPQPDDLNLLALRARWDDANGRPAEALGRFREALVILGRRPDIPAESAAWYHTMVGHTLIDSGKLDEGERACRNALAIFPNDYRAMTGLAEAAAWRGDADATLTWARKAIALAPQNPEALRLIGDALAKQGKAREAEHEYRLLKELAHSFPRIYDRHWVVFCADTGRDLDEALALARKDLELRHDVHAHDTLAWACFKKGLLDEADAESKLALARGVQDATLYHHAAEIARARGDAARADEDLAKAKALNPYLVP